MNLCEKPARRFFCNPAPQAEAEKFMEKLPGFLDLSFGQINGDMRRSDERLERAE